MIDKAELLKIFHNQKVAFETQVPDYSQRIKALNDLSAAIHQRQDELLQAVSDDFGGRAYEETLLLELFPLYDQIRHTKKHLKGWMRRKKVSTSWYLLPSKAFYQYQPLGVVGILGAWNYQLLLTLGPLIDALAAGNHVIIKPSEITPRSAGLISQIISETFPQHYVTCITGGVEVASAFATIPFDHLFFTGSTHVGKLVMKAAAENLTPVTLELGGKSPAVIHKSYPLDTAVKRIMVGKLYNAGQTCVAPDYILLPEGLEDAFEQSVRKAVIDYYPKIKDNKDYTRIVNQRHFERLKSLVTDAEIKGARAVTFHPQELPAKDDRIILPTLIFSPKEDMKVMQEEIFGPVLPIITYKKLEDAMKYINDRPKPLALYYFDNNSKRVNYVLRHSLSGGVTINNTVFHLGQHNLPFGGVGASGMGHYHGFDGFVTFSKKRGVMVERKFSGTSLFHAPYTPFKRKLISFIMKLARR